MKRGMFIVIDGLDGSGKGVQTTKLVERLQQEQYPVEMADFPQYDNWSAVFVQQYLNGAFGSASEVSAKKASLFYALDRFAAGSKIQQWLDEGKVVISNRYVSANKGHQLGKITDETEMGEFLSWLNEIEYSTLEIPIPDMTLFLHMSPEIGQRLVDKKGERSYTDRKRDIHEEDLDHLQNAERAYLFCLDNDPVENWQRIVCFEGNEPRTIDDIHAEVYQKVIEKIK
ncbi:hypothetical protein HOL21_01685 [Candidatus Woesearchaeota archaeon]|jgi:dTMP kinase|nr:hypothetical protein [Candidatus Woesearchaeota archaeon]MBT5396904.1 hypothetical protein [Candidatus Woesearchaeota archaeon]MBT5924509.1 hypothetical protein [Candidatus Woesearchaeota archaeon]MBT6367097.1 hypothetical protein [Candidatus Woesearchaeota archaeon]MBT7762329.1 hypothetical protein [Candidatus Woesearchaeota archaeon]